MCSQAPLGNASREAPLRPIMSFRNFHSAPHDFGIANCRQRNENIRNLRRQAVVNAERDTKIVYNPPMTKKTTHLGGAWALQVPDFARRIGEAARAKRVVLFGSAARGDMRPHSDLDFLVIIPDTRSLGGDNGSGLGQTPASH